MVSRMGRAQIDTTLLRSCGRESARYPWCGRATRCTAIRSCTRADTSRTSRRDGELESFFSVCRGASPAGAHRADRRQRHECLGGAERCSHGVERRYETICDPAQRRRPRPRVPRLRARSDNERAERADGGRRDHRLERRDGRTFREYVDTETLSTRGDFSPTTCP